MLEYPVYEYGMESIVADFTAEISAVGNVWWWATQFRANIGLGYVIMNVYVSFFQNRLV